MKITMNNLTKQYAGDVILDTINLEITEYTKCAIVGENGSGKTTLLKIIAGIENYQEGQLSIPKNTNIGYMQQSFTSYKGSVEQHVRDAFPELSKTEARLRRLEIEMSKTDNLNSVLKQYEKTQAYFEAIEGYTFETNLERFSQGLGVQELLAQEYEVLSGGEKTRIALLKLLLSDVDVYCLDEPTNHLDLEGIKWLENYLHSLKKTIIVVSHDRQFLTNIVDVFHEIEDGNITTYYGTYEQYRKQRTQRYYQLVHDYDNQQKEIQKIKLSIRRFRQWGNESDNVKFYKKARTLEKRLERIEMLPKPSELDSNLTLDLKVQTRSGEDVLKLNQVIVGYNKPLIQPLDLFVQRKDCIAIQADNGVGKTTLLKTILNEIQPLSGEVKVGSNVKIGYLPQQHHMRDETIRILQYIMYECDLGEEKARQYLARFGFYSKDTYKPISVLSGGEKVRLKLIELMLSDVNLLILDEPTNHLDFASIEIIESAITKYEGTLLVISHDRYFLDRIQASIVCVEKNEVLKKQ